MSFEFHIPHRSLDQKISADALIDLPRVLEGEDRLVFRDVLDRCILNGVETIRPIVEGLEAMGPEDRRRCLDACRRRAGLETASDIEHRASFEMAQEMARRRTPSEEPPQLVAGGAIIQPPSAADLRAIKRRDKLEAEKIKHRREARDAEAAERRAAKAGADDRYRPTGPGWTTS